MAKKTKIEQPNNEAQQAYNEIVEDIPEVVSMGGKKYKIGAMTNELVRRLTHLAMSEKDESKVTTKSVAMIVLRRWWKIKLFYPILWRWYYYIKEIPEAELSAVIETAKKKLPVESYYRNTILLIGMKDTAMAMTREEVNHFLQEQRGVQVPT
jgi:hypothetical protein